MLNLLIDMRMRVPMAALMLAALLCGQGSKKDYVERRAVILRQMAEVKAKLAALELELQILEEARSAEPGAPPAPATSWRDEAALAAEPSPKKAVVRCVSVTRDGKRCTRSAEAGSKFCWQHKNH